KLTLDATIQHLLEVELDSIVEESHPLRACIVAMDPMTGKVLGMGSRPSFDPNNYYDTKAEQRRNLATSMIYEPGSTFKIITGAIALEEKIIASEEKFNDPGYLKVGNKVITNWDSEEKSHGVITFSDGMRLSSNVVLAQVGEKIGADVFYTYLKSFGFGSKTGIDISGEERGLLIDKEKVKDIELATMSFGQANLVTPIQLITAISAVANGGNLYEPYLLDKIIDSKGEFVYEHEPIINKKVISKTTSSLMTDILESVVDDGTGKIAQIPGIKVAGKTGTAQKIDPVTKEYSETDYVASFVAYAPTDDPRIAVLVVIDTPEGDNIQGGRLAGPHVKKIIEGALQYYGISVASNTPSDINDLDLEVNLRPDPEVVKPERSPGNGEAVVPNLKGLTIRQVGEILGNLELKGNLVGSGLVIKQSPQAGKVINKGDCVEVIFEPQK
ncbi:MAG: penicillin-binding transpeptidase domain-containing protein, partial [Eubacteriales bacterium]